MREPMLVDSPRIHPGICLDGNQQACVDTFLEPPGYGRVYLSRPMVRDAARLFPGLREELAGEILWVDAVAHQEAIDERDRRIEELETRLAELLPIERAITRVAMLEQRSAA